MYLLLDHIKGKNYLLYKKKKRVLYNFHCSSLCYKSLAVATWLVPNSLYILNCVNYF